MATTKNPRGDVTQTETFFFGLSKPKGQQPPWSESASTVSIQGPSLKTLTLCIVGTRCKKYMTLFFPVRYLVGWSYIFGCILPFSLFN